MKKALAVLCVVCGLLACPRPALAQYLSARDLAYSCLSDKKEQMSACINYIAGVIDYHTLMMSFGTAPTIDFCLPESISKEKAAVIVMAYLRTSSQNDAFTAAAVVPLALNKAFPCRPAPVKKKKRKRSE